MISLICKRVRNLGYLKCGVVEGSILNAYDGDLTYISCSEILKMRKHLNISIKLSYRFIDNKLGKIVFPS